jgi:hypothetical protein
MPRFRCEVTAYGYYDVEAFDTYEADEKARSLTTANMKDVDWIEVDGDASELPQPI